MQVLNRPELSCVGVPSNIRHSGNTAGVACGRVCHIGLGASPPFARIR